MQRKGFTLIELLIVISIIAILGLMVLFGLINYLAKSRDSKRKTDLNRLKTAFEEYYVDSNVYPVVGVLDDCGGDTLKPYLNTIPCDPKTKKPYCYIYDTTGKGQNYHILASLENLNDPISATLNCDVNPDYCGYEIECSTLGSKFDYGIASSNVIVNREIIGSGSLGTPTPSPTSSTSPSPLPSSVPGQFACYRDSCQNYGSLALAIAAGCPITWNVDTCDFYCNAGTPSSMKCDR